MKTARRILKLFGILLLLVVALAGGAVAMLTLTERGRDNLAAIISSQASSPGSGVQITGISGIWSGPLRIDGLVLSDAEGAWLAAKGVTVDWSLGPLLSGTFAARLVHADRIELARLPGDSGTGSGGGGLPVNLQIDRIDLPEIALGNQLAGEVAQVSAEGSLDVNAEPMIVKSVLKVARTDGKAGTLDAKVDFAPATDTLAVDLHASEPAGGIIASMLQLPGAPPVEIALVGTGPADDWNLAGSFAVDGQVVTSITGKRQLTPAGNRVEARGDGDFGRFVPETLRGLIAGQTSFDFAGTIGEQGRIDVETASLQSPVLTATASGRIDTAAGSDFSLEVAARDGSAPLAFGEGADAVTIGVRQIALRAFGPGEAPMIDASVSVDKVTAPEVELAGVEATLHSDGFDLRNMSGPLSVSATAANAVSPDETIASLLAGALKIDLTATASADRLRIDSGALANDAVSATVAGDVLFADASLSLDVTAAVPSTLVPEAARAPLADKIELAARLGRTAGGVLQLDGITLRSGDLNAAGTATYAAEMLNAQLTGTLAEISKLSGEVAGALAFDVKASGPAATPDVTATVTSEKLSTGETEIQAVSITANTRVGAAGQPVDVSARADVSGQTVAAKGVVSEGESGTRRIQGLTLTVGPNTISGDLVLGADFVPEGVLALSLPNVTPLAALAQQSVDGAVTGTVRLSRANQIPQMSIEAAVPQIVRGAVSVKDAQVAALVTNYLQAPVLSGNVKAASLVSGGTTVTGIDVDLDRDGSWTGFSGGATVDDIAVRLAGRLAMADGTTTVEMSSASARGPGIEAALAPATIVVRSSGDPAAGNEIIAEMAGQQPRATITVGDGDGAVRITLDSTSVHIRGPDETAVVDVSARIASIVAAQAELHDVEAKLHSDGFDIGTLSGPLTLSTTAASGGSVDETIAGLLAGSLKLDVTATASPDDLQISQATLVTDTLNGAVSGTVPLRAGPLTLNVRADLLKALLPEAARAPLADRVHVAATLNRSADGAIKLDSLEVQSGDLTAGGTVSYAADSLDAQIRGSLADISKLSADVGGAVAFEVRATGTPTAPDVSASISSDRLTAAGRDITALSLTAATKVGAAEPTVDVTLKGDLAGQTISGGGVVRIAGADRRVEGLRLSVGANTISGDLTLDDAFVPEGTLTLSLPDIGPLASMATETASGALDGTIAFSKTDGVPQIALDATAATLTRGDVSVGDARVNVLVANYMQAPAISGKITAASVTAGGTEVRDVDVALTRDGDWTGFDGGATVDGIVARLDGRAALADGKTTVELNAGSLAGPGLNGTITPTTVVVTTDAASGGSGLSVDVATRQAPVSVAIGEGEGAVTVALTGARLRLSGPQASSTIRASADIDSVATAAATVRGIRADLKSDAFDLGNLSGPLTLSATAAGTSSADAAVAGLLAGVLKVDVAATVAQDTVRIDSGRLANDVVTVTASGDVSRTDGSLALDLKADLPAALLPEAARPVLDDRIAATARLTRDATGAIRADPIRIASGIFDAGGSVSYAQDALEAAIKGGLADISRLAPGASGAITFEIGAKGSPAAPDLSATIFSDKLTAAGRDITGLSLSASGKFDAASPAASVSLKGNVAGQALSGEAVLRTTEGQRRIDNLSLTLGANKIGGSLVLDEAMTPEGTLAFTLPDIAPLAALALDNAAGAADGNVRFSRQGGVPQLAVDVRAARIVRGDLAVKDAAVTATIMDYLSAPTISGKVKAGSVVSGATVATDISVDLKRDGTWTGFNGGATVNGIEARAAGRVAVAGGTTTVELSTGSARMQGITAGLSRATTIVVKDGAVTLDRVALGVGSGTVQVTGTAAQQLNLQVQINALPAGVVNAFAPGLNAAGTISGSARITGEAVAPNVGYTLAWRGAQTAQTMEAGLGAMSVTSSGTLSGSSLKFTANVSDSAGLGLRGGGSVDTGGGSMSLDFTGQVPFAFLSGRMAEQGLALSGTSNVTLSLRGPLAAPVIGGSITASGARFVDASSGLALDGIDLDIGIANSVATVRRLQGKVSSGGSISASGTVGIDPARGFPANLTVRIVDARYMDGRIVTTNLSGVVTVTGPLASQATLGGTIDLDRTIITIPERLPTSIAELDVKHKNAPAAVVRQAEEIAPATAGGGSSGSGMLLDLTVNAPQQIYVRGRGLDAELGGSIKLTGPLSAPRAVGQFELRRGRLTLLSRRLNFTHGTLGFSGSLVPTLDFAATSTASDATITVGVVGLATNPRFSFSSSPALPQDEVLARLIFGRSMSKLSALQIAQLADAAAQLAGAGGSSSLLETLRSRLGVDDLDVTTDEKGGTAVSAGKYLNDRTYVTIQKGEKAGSGKVTIDLDVGRGVKLRGEVNENGGGKGGIFYEREY